jgi:hypothetical protein
MYVAFSDPRPSFKSGKRKIVDLHCSQVVTMYHSPAWGLSILGNTHTHFERFCRLQDLVLHLSFSTRKQRPESRSLLVAHSPLWHLDCLYAYVLMRLVLQQLCDSVSF